VGVSLLCWEEREKGRIYLVLAAHRRLQMKQPLLSHLARRRLLGVCFVPCGGGLGGSDQLFLAR
jgi:hypothetical protein